MSIVFELVTFTYTHNNWQDYVSFASAPRSALIAPAMISHPLQSQRGKVKDVIFGAFVGRRLAVGHREVDVALARSLHEVRLPVPHHKGVGVGL